MSQPRRFDTFEWKTNRYYFLMRRLMDAMALPPRDERPPKQANRQDSAALDLPRGEGRNGR